MRKNALPSAARESAACDGRWGGGGGYTHRLAPALRPLLVAAVPVLLQLAVHLHEELPLEVRVLQLHVHDVAVVLDEDQQLPPRQLRDGVVAEVQAGDAAVRPQGLHDYGHACIVNVVVGQLQRVHCIRLRNGRQCSGKTLCAEVVVLQVDDGEILLLLFQLLHELRIWLLHIQLLAFGQIQHSVLGQNIEDRPLDLLLGVELLQFCTGLRQIDLRPLALQPVVLQALCRGGPLVRVWGEHVCDEILGLLGDVVPDCPFVESVLCLRHLPEHLGAGVCMERGIPAQ
mmetsp:Transcript_12570/g.19469  ORF Transcript_12570/g.19469 Transcript_12570/m.19469 type:complete len:286 (-) Transcript_12570:722-1579(-)